LQKPDRPGATVAALARLPWGRNQTNRKPLKPFTKGLSGRHSTVATFHRRLVRPLLVRFSDRGCRGREHAGRPLQENLQPKDRACRDKSGASTAGAGADIGPSVSGITLGIVRQAGF